jgi:diguanylate cyclase (GGDEF)-like protein
VDSFGLNIALLSVLVLIFAWILHKRRTAQIQLWFLAWVLLLVNAALGSASRFGRPSTTINAIQLAAIALAGSLFVVAVSSVYQDVRNRWQLTAALAIPGVILITAAALNFRAPTFAVLLVCASVCAVVAVEFRHHGLTRYLGLIITVSLLAGAAIAISAVRYDFETAVRISLAALFLVAGCLFIHRFPRFSMGVMIAACGLFAWGSDFLLDSSILVANTSVESFNGLLMLAKYLVAIGMIVTVLEEQIEEAGEVSQQLEHQANHDNLTALPNRILLQDRLNQALARCRRGKNLMAVFCIDLDRFKQINDSFGHRVGDLFLKEVAQRLSMRVREGDTLARTGGDEFTAILENIRTPEDATKIAQALLDTLTRPVVVEDINLVPSASIGVAVYPFDGNDSDSLRRAADQAMFRAKSLGRNQFESSSEEVRETLEIENTLRKALDVGGFHLQFQPQVRRDGSIAAVEALLRFTHPKLGLLPPSRFIPIAEESGLIIQIGDWVLQEVCRQGMEWRRKLGIDMRIAVNVSPLQFSRADFAGNVESILRQSGFDPNLIELELTETLVMRDVQESSRQLSQLKRLGFHIAVDDFGTGYSSLSYLHQLPIDTLKIDKSFIDKVTEPSGTRPIVEAVVSLSKSLALTTIAEGVETRDQFDVLNELGCDVIQGYYFFKPLPIDAIEKLMLKSREQSVAGLAKMQAAD